MTANDLQAVIDDYEMQWGEPPVAVYLHPDDLLNIARELQGPVQNPLSRATMHYSGVSIVREPKCIPGRALASPC